MAADDIEPLILKASCKFEQLSDIQPEMFEDVSDEQLAKFDKFLMEMSEIERKQNDILEDIQVSQFFSFVLSISVLIVTY